MGGNAFKFVKRINREDIPDTINHIVSTLQYPSFTVDYVNKALMGSVGKKPTSGDIDIAMNTYAPKFVGETEHPVFSKYDFLTRINEVLPKSQVSSTTIKMGNLMTAWPIAGKPENGFIQVDFIFGKLEWLVFTHYSPSEQESRFKGVFLQQGLGILAKMMKDIEIFDDTRFEQDGESPLRVGRVGLHLSLELGLFRSWQAEVVRNQGPRRVDPGAFETKFVEAEHYQRVGFIDDPQAVLDIVLQPGVRFDQINTFEKLVYWLNTNSPERAVEFKERFLNNLSRHNAMLKEISVEDMENDEIWNV